MNALNIFLELLSTDTLMSDIDHFLTPLHIHNNGETWPTPINNFKNFLNFMEKDRPLVRHIL